MTPEKKTPILINVVAALAVLTMLGVAAASFKVLKAKPEMINNERVVILPNDTVGRLLRKVDSLTVAVREVTVVAETRRELLLGLAEPLRATSDTLLAGVRYNGSHIAEIYDRQAENMAKRDQLEAVRTERFNRVMDRLELLPDRSEVSSLFASTTPPGRRDTVFNMFPHPARQRWGLQLEPYLEGGLNTQLQPTLRGGARLWLKKSKE